MHGMMRGYVRGIEAVNHVIGRIVMWGIFALMGVLFYSIWSKAFSLPALWTLEMAQFVMVAYYVLGGAYSMQTGAHVRMDLLYGDWSPRRKAWADLFTIWLLIFYLCVLIYGGVASAAYSLGYWGQTPFGFFAGLATGSEEIGTMERSSSAWRPYLWPIKGVMVLGFTLMLLQCVAEFFRSVLVLRNDPMPERIPA
ncbi:TRAP transporter small permease subunit [Palleronia sp. LCG004]|uniref:TRAP transporter small permease subunit n=1 Tax=Palleronia sp. LCG004 TaxID=3079304 RepID=UPI0029438C7C|nr:TRAP transporter small permease subunit [Palleronia sp. LCG004]WOI56235.1 TRAP transporter small permease subunit [Palleronia sp. LCG004]